MATCIFLYNLSTTKVEVLSSGVLLESETISVDGLLFEEFELVSCVHRVSNCNKLLTSQP